MRNAGDVLTAELGELLELGLPLRIDEDGLLLLLLVVQGEAVGLALAQQLPGVLRMERRQDGEEVLAAACPPDGVLVGEVVLHAVQLEAGLVEVGHRHLVVLRRVADLDLAGLEELLLAREDLPEPGRGDHAVRRHVVLASTREDEEREWVLTAAPSCRCRSSTCR